MRDGGKRGNVQCVRHGVVQRENKREAGRNTVCTRDKRMSERERGREGERENDGIT